MGWSVPVGSAAAGLSGSSEVSETLRTRASRRAVMRRTLTLPTRFLGSAPAGLEARVFQVGMGFVSQARAEVRATGDPGPGAVAGSAGWFDAARGVLTLNRDPQDPERRILECAKANHGRSGWGAALTPRHARGGRFAGFALAERMDPAALREWRAGVAAAARAKGKPVRAAKAAAATGLVEW